MTATPTHFQVPSKTHADMLVEVLEKSAVTGPQAQTLADLYRLAKAAQASLGGP